MKTTNEAFAQLDEVFAKRAPGDFVIPQAF